MIYSVHLVTHGRILSIAWHCVTPSVRCTAEQPPSVIARITAVTPTSPIGQGLATQRRRAAVCGSKPSASRRHGAPTCTYLYSTSVRAPTKFRDSLPPSPTRYGVVLTAADRALGNAVRFFPYSLIFYPLDHSWASLSIARRFLTAHHYNSTSSYLPITCAHGHSASAHSRHCSPNRHLFTFRDTTRVVCSSNSVVSILRHDVY